MIEDIHDTLLRHKLDCTLDLHVLYDISFRLKERGK